MKFSLSWLKTHLDTDASLEQICERLTAIGLEVEGVEDTGKKLAPFIIAEIAEAVQHPNAVIVTPNLRTLRHEFVHIAYGVHAHGDPLFDCE